MLTLIKTDHKVIALNGKQEIRLTPEIESVEYRERKDMSHMRGRVKQSKPRFKIGD